MLCGRISDVQVLRRGWSVMKAAGRSLITEACEWGHCGRCFKGRDGGFGWCEHDCHPPRPESAWARRWRRLRRGRLRSRSSRGDLDAMQRLATKGNPDYVRVRADTFHEVLGEDL